MILTDTSIWIDHIRQADPVLRDLLSKERVLTHPFVIGELAVGRFRSRAAVLEELQYLPRTMIATDGEVLRFIERHTLFGLGIGYIDACLLASAQLTPGASIWTRDKRLLAAAKRFSLAANLAH